MRHLVANNLVDPSHVICRSVVRLDQQVMVLTSDNTPVFHGGRILPLMAGNTYDVWGKGEKTEKTHWRLRSRCKTHNTNAF